MHSAFFFRLLPRSTFDIRHLTSTMDLQDQLKKLFPTHEPLPEEIQPDAPHQLHVQKEPMICKFEKRNGKPATIIEGYEGNEEDFKQLAKDLKVKLGVGGSFRDGAILIQGDYRDKVMQILQRMGFKTKRVGG